MIGENVAARAFSFDRHPISSVTTAHTLVREAT
jgi:hypothetical protein